MKNFILLLFFHSYCFSNSITPSVLMFHEWDLNDCKSRAQKSLSFDKRSIHFLLAGQFIASNKNVTSYCFNTVDSKCSPINQPLLKKIEGKMKDCLQVLPEQTEINISFHLNDSKGSNSVWRNSIIFDPQLKYEQVSYQEFLINPILNALDSVNNKEIRISLQGEMGATIFTHPSSYEKLINTLKIRYPLYKFGISTNYNKLTGGAKNIDFKAVQKMINALDFLGFSAYSPFNPYDLGNAFEKYTNNFISRMNKLSLSIPDSTELLFSEIGLGGGNWLNNGNTQGENIEQVSGAPYAGIYVEKGNNNPWINEELKYFRRRYYLYLNSYLNSKNSKISRAFVWNAASWDIHGIYPGSENFKDHLLAKKLGEIK